MNLNNHKPTIGKLKYTAQYRVCTDGAADKLQSSQPHPHLVAGDFDSIEKNTLLNLQNSGTEIVLAADQNETDFTKCVRLIQQRRTSNALMNQVSTIIALGGLNGRFDHVLAALNTLHKAPSITTLPLYLIDHSSFACVLQTVSLFAEGDNLLCLEECQLGTSCGLAPLAAPATDICTDGLKYNMAHGAMCFGGLVSTSNTIVSSNVQVNCDQPLLWCMEIAHH